jgi:hypothetical protein
MKSQVKDPGVKAQVKAGKGLIKIVVCDRVRWNSEPHRSIPPTRPPNRRFGAIADDPIVVVVHESRVTSV